MTRKVLRVHLPASLLFMMLAGCRDDDSSGVPPEVLLQRATAFRQACASEELVRTAEENLELLEATAALYMQRDSTQGAAPAPVAAVEFTRAYLRHAELRATVYALMDSAVNHAAGPQDSIQYMERASAFTIRSPEPGTVEANVIQSFEENLIRILADDDHRCNWDIPALQEQ